MADTYGMRKHRLDSFVYTLCRAKHSVEVAKATRKFANTRTHLTTLCMLMERKVPKMYNREQTLRAAADIIDDAEVHAAALQHGLVEAQEELAKTMHEGHYEPVQEIDSLVSSKIVLGTIIAVVVVVVTRIAGIW